MTKQLTQEAPALATVAPEVPKNLSQAMDRCLAKDPEERFQGGEQLAEALTSTLAVKREVPVPLRVFAEQNSESTTAIVGFGALTLTLMAVAVTAVIATGQAEASMLLPVAALAAALGAAPLGMLALMSRRLLESGYTYDEMLTALRRDVEEGHREIAGDTGQSATFLDVWAPRVALAGLALLLLPLTVVLFWFDPASALANLVGGTMLGGLVLGLGGGIVTAARGALSKVSGERWLRFWETPLGRGIFKLSKIRLGSVEATGAAYGHTEMAIGMAADRLFEGLPKDVQKSFGELPDVVRTLEQDADRVRSRIKELDALIAQVESEEALGKSGRVAASPGVADKRDSLADDLRSARDAADTRLSEVVAALETIRLELLRMHAGAGNVESMTADLSAARELSEDIEHVLEGRREVHELLGLGKPTDPSETPTPTPA